MVVGEEDVIKSLDDGGDAWQVGPDAPAAAILDRYRAETDLADTIIAATAADTPWPGGLTTSSASHTCPPCETSCCTSSPRLRAVPATSMCQGNSSTADGGWF
ncbi:hypothetical protein [Streptomyces sp. NPDC057681]|uniref:hypothetical protein n=1 Tax=unclassified Streptomyces TaxID=2593676 RepID=UPI0036B114DE